LQVHDPVPLGPEEQVPPVVLHEQLWSQFEPKIEVLLHRSQLGPLKFVLQTQDPSPVGPVEAETIPLGKQVIV
jgi:hypothetical protein